MKYLRAALAVLLVLAVAIGGGLIAYKTAAPPAPEPGPAKVVKQTPQGTVTAPAAKVEKAEDIAAAEIADHGGKVETLTPTERERLNAQAKAGTTGSDVLPPIQAGASFSQPGCKTMPVVNYGPRRGRPGIGVAHYWAGPFRNLGWSGVFGIVNLFNNPRYQASSNYVFAAGGQCAYIVPETANAWAQGDMNQATACSGEMEGDAARNGYEYRAGLLKAAKVFLACFKRWGIPIRVGKTSGCNIVRTGLVDHDELNCGNDHTDVRTNGVCPNAGIGCVARIVAVMKELDRAAASPLVKVERAIVRGVRHAKGTGHTRSYWRARACTRLDRLDRIHRRGRPWKDHHSGIRRKAMAGAAGERCG